MNVPNYLNPQYLYGKEVGVFRRLWDFITSPDTLSGYHTILFLLAMFFITIIFYCLVRVLEIRRKEKAHLRHEIAEYAKHHAEKEREMQEGEAVSKNPRWREVLRLLFSGSPNDWKLSVIEADAMLEALLGDLGYVGESLGEKLKDAVLRGFRPLQSAWEVHSARNRIAHEGSIFELSHHEAKRLIAQYEQIFREFGHI